MSLIPTPGTPSIDPEGDDYHKKMAEANRRQANRELTGCLGFIFKGAVVLGIIGLVLHAAGALEDVIIGLVIIVMILVGLSS